MIYTRFKLIVVCFISLFFAVSAHVVAQETPETSPAPEPSTNDEEEIENIIVSGRNYDAALKAFNSGDYATAEIEFKKNALCALRIERAKDAFVSGLQTSAINNNTQSGVGGANTQTGRTSAGAGEIAAGFTGNVGGRSDNKDDKQSGSERTCENRAYQLYMMGLSQLQLGKSDEAEKNFKSAVFLNRNIYDAQFKLALMEMLRGENKKAQGRSEELEDILKRCDDCEAKTEIEQRLVYVQKALNGEISLQ